MDARLTHDSTGIDEGRLPQDADRARAFKHARRNTFVVKTLRKLLPVGAVALMAIYVASAFTEVQFDAGGLANLTIPEITSKDLTMRNPRYSGFTNDGGRYEIKADSARQDFSVRNRIDLSGITGNLTDAKGGTTDLSAETGAYRTDNGILDLTGKIQVRSSDGLQADLTQARITTKTRRIESSEPVRVQMNANRIDAKTLTIEQTARRATFSGDVVAVLDQAASLPPAPKPAARDGAPASASGAEGLGGLMSGTGGPVTVTSEKLTVENSNGVAAFEGNVQAEQQTNRLETARLEVHYGAKPDAAGAAVTSGDAAAAFGQAQAVDAIVSPGELRISNTDGQSARADRGTFKVKERTALLTGNVRLTNGATAATAQEASLDAARNLAVLTGDVRLSGGEGRAAQAQRVEFWTAANRARMTKDVVLVQGDNILAGGDLSLDQAAGRMTLTSPPDTSSKPGRIAARLKPPARQEKKSKGSTLGGLGGFRTDPNAPINIEAARLDVDDSTKNAVFSGDVVASQDGFTMRTATLRADYTGSGGLAATGSPFATTPRVNKEKSETQISRIRAEGKVRLESAQGQTAEGDWANFDVAKNEIILGGEVILRQGKSELRGNRLAVNLATGRTSLTTTSSQPAGGWATSSNPAKKRTTSSASANRDGAGTRGSRPSALFFPQDLKKRSQ